MTKLVWALLAGGIIAIVILIFAVRSCRPPSFESQRIEINATPGTRVFIKLPEKNEKYIRAVPATVDIPIAAIVILRYKDKEQVFSHDQWKTGQISHNFDSRNVGSRKPVTSLVSVSINAVPWAEVFIKLPGTHHFITPRKQNFIISPEPNGKDTNVTPIRGGMKVPVGTAIKLVYDGKEQIFPYKSWKARHSISHDFLAQ